MAGPSGVNLNWNSVQFASTPIKRINSVNVNQGGGLIKYSGDNDRYPTLAAIGVNNPSMSISTADVGTAMGFVIGTQGTLTATLNDALGPVAGIGGAVVFSMGQATISDVSGNGAHAQFAGATINADGISTDGSTNPLSFTRA